MGEPGSTSALIRGSPVTKHEAERHGVNWLPIFRKDGGNAPFGLSFSAHCSHLVALTGNKLGIGAVVPEDR
jgi:hypothetical protein